MLAELSPHLRTAVRAAYCRPEPIYVVGRPEVGLHPYPAATRPSLAVVRSTHLVSAAVAERRWVEHGQSTAAIDYQ